MFCYLQYDCDDGIQREVCRIRENLPVTPQDPRCCFVSNSILHSVKFGFRHGISLSYRRAKSKQLPIPKTKYPAKYTPCLPAQKKFFAKESKKTRKHWLFVYAGG